MGIDFEPSLSVHKSNGVSDLLPCPVRVTCIFEGAVTTEKGDHQDVEPPDKGKGKGKGKKGGNKGGKKGGKKGHDDEAGKGKGTGKGKSKGKGKWKGKGKGKQKGKWVEKIYPEEGGN